MRIPEKRPGGCGTNENVEIARDFHEETKHSPVSIRVGLRRLDWVNKPLPFKVYEDLPSFPLPKDFDPPSTATPLAISSTGKGGDPNLESLAQLLYFAAGITKQARTPDGTTLHFRAAASAGALYPIELYLVCGPLPGLPEGVYHFAPREFSLTQLRAGDFRTHLAGLAGMAESAPSAMVALTAIFWRSAWKYLARSYRYCFWDAGTILANLLATATAADLKASVVAGFADSPLNHLLGVDGIHEAGLCLVPLGHSVELPPSPTDLPALRPKTVPLSREAVEYPSIQKVHLGSSLENPDEVRNWKGSLPRDPRVRGGKSYPLNAHEGQGEPLEQTILRRGSTRHFRRTPVDPNQLGSVLQHATRGFESDFLEGTDTRLADIYLILNEVAGIPSGAYYYPTATNELELLKEGEFRQQSGYLGLEQALPADASAVVFFLADLQRVFARFGNRGYRAAQLEAGILGGRMYLAAYALGLGATGLTFYDDEIVEFFSPHAEGKDAIFMVALGKAVRVRSRVRPVAPPYAKESR